MRTGGRELKIKVVENIMKSNDAQAAENRQRLNVAGVLCLNILSGPGSGKTTLLEKTLELLGPERCAVMVGDLQTTRDAERLGASGAESIQINTGKGCHLSAAQVARGLEQLDLSKIDYLFIENVGNMVCPAGHDLGEHKKVVLLSLPEGDDKVAKYWTLFQGADLIMLSKIDLLEYLDFDFERVREDISKLNGKAPLIEISSKLGKGLEQWLSWLGEVAKLLG